MSQSIVIVERLSAAGATAVARVDAPASVLADVARGLPDGPALAEVLALRLARNGFLVAERERAARLPELLLLAAARGRSSVEMLRAEPEIARDMEIGSWFDARPRRRLLRRILVHFPVKATFVPGRLPGRVAGVLAEAAFWRGVRWVATGLEWRRLTRSSYAVLYYHRLAGELKPGQERLDVPPSLFARQVRLLHRLRFRPLAPEELIAFHEGSLPVLPRRSYVITADDGFLDCVEPFLRHAEVRPQLYVPTAEVGGRSWWAGDEPLADWGHLRRLAEAGVGVGSHGRRHVSLPDLDDATLAEELVSSHRALQEKLPSGIPLLAYPHGRRDERVAAASAAAGFRLAFTTDPGRNGAGTNPLALHRIGAKAWDSQPSFLWKVVTGELLSNRWEARRLRRSLRSSRPLQSRSGADAA